MHIIALADRVAGVIGSILDLVGEGDMHGGALFGTRKSDNPTHAEGLGAIGVYFVIVELTYRDFLATSVLLVAPVLGWLLITQSMQALLRIAVEKPLYLGDIITISPQSRYIAHYRTLENGELAECSSIISRSLRTLENGEPGGVQQRNSPLISRVWLRREHHLA